jgi:hypothetical protein
MLLGIQAGRDANFEILKDIQQIYPLPETFTSILYQVQNHSSQ